MLGSLYGIYEDSSYTKVPWLGNLEAGVDFEEEGNDRAHGENDSDNRRIFQDTGALA